MLAQKKNFFPWSFFSLLRHVLYCFAPQNVFRSAIVSRTPRIFSSTQNRRGLCVFAIPLLVSSHVSCACPSCPSARLPACLCCAAVLCRLCVLPRHPLTRFSSNQATSTWWRCRGREKCIPGVTEPRGRAGTGASCTCECRDGWPPCRRCRFRR